MLLFLQKQSCTTLIGYIATFFSVITFGAYAAIGFYDGIYVIALPTISSLVYLGLISFSRNLELCSKYLVISFLSIVTLFVILSNGIYSPYIIWLVAVPVAAYLLSGKRIGDIIFFITISIFLVLGGLQYSGVEMPRMIVGDWFSYFTLLSVVLFLVYIVFFGELVFAHC